MATGSGAAGGTSAGVSPSGVSEQATRADAIQKIANKSAVKRSHFNLPCFILTSKKQENDDKTVSYKNTILEYTDSDGFIEVLSFDYSNSAMSFVKNGDTYYVGIGNYNDKATDKTSNGMILKIEKATN